MDDAPRPHPVVWTPERIARFWDLNAGGEASQADYFSHHAGPAILRAVERSTRLRGRRVLDYGCGPGHLLAHLIARGARVRGLEFSPASVEAASRRFEGDPSFRGVVFATTLPSTLPAAEEEVVMLIEVVEHLDDARLHATLDEVRRLLVPGGRVVITTPNDEDLSVSTLVCPECSAAFHRWQHVRSFTPAGLARLLGEHGFRQVECRITLFANLAPAARLRRLARRLLLRPARRPHLLYVGERPAGS